MRAVRVSIALSVVAVAGWLAAGGGDARARTERACPPRPPVTTHRIVSPRWLSGAVVTEYYPVREAWFSATLARVPALPGRHRVGWLYGPHGVAMNGEGGGPPMLSWPGLCNEPAACNTRWGATIEDDEFGDAWA